MNKEWPAITFMIVASNQMLIVLKIGSSDSLRNHKSTPNDM